MELFKTGYRYYIMDTTSRRVWILRLNEEKFKIFSITNQKLLIAFHVTLIMF